jgi:tetratricopeptide (TPR) repeat protein
MRKNSSSKASSSKAAALSFLRQTGLFLATVTSLNGCAPAYDRYMQEGHKLHGAHENSKARESFHAAVIEARHDTKGKERLIDALLAEKECAVELKQTDDAQRLLNEAATIMEKNSELKRAAMLHKEAGELCAPDDITTALDCFNSGLADLKEAGLENTPENASLLAAVGDTKSAQGDLKAAQFNLEKACAILDKIKYNENDRAHANYLHRLAAIYDKENRDNDAIDANEKAKKYELSGIDYAIGRQPKL